MEPFELTTDEMCLSLADGFIEHCPLVHKHNVDIGAPAEDVIEIPEDLKDEFAKLSTNLNKLGRAFELGLID